MDINGYINGYLRVFLGVFMGITNTTELSRIDFLASFSLLFGYSWVYLWV